MRAVLSTEAVAMRVPSRLKAQCHTLSSCPCRTAARIAHEKSCRAPKAAASDAITRPCETTKTDQAAGRHQVIFRRGDECLAAQKAVRVQDLANETSISPTRVAPALKAAIENYAAQSGVVLNPKYDAENLSSVVSLVMSTGGVTLTPLYVRLMLPSSVVIHRLQGDAPSIELALGYNRSNTSAVLKRFLAQADQLIARVENPDADFLSVP